MIEPPRPLPALSLPLAASRDDAGPRVTDPQFLKGKWTFLYVQHGRCDEECLRHLYDTRQVRMALDRDMHRVQRVFIGDADCCDMTQLKAAHPDLIAIRAGAADEPLLALLPSEHRARFSAHLSDRSAGQSHDVLCRRRPTQRHARRHEAAAALVVDRLTHGQRNDV